MGKEEYRPKGDFVYHFNKDEMDRERNRISEPPKKSRPFRDNKTLLIILLDIGVIVLFAMIIVPILRKPYAVNNLEGYAVNLRAFHSKSSTYVTLEVINNNDKSKDSPGGELGKIEYYSKDGHSSDEITVILPEPGYTKDYDYVFKGDTLKRVYANVSVRGKNTVLRVKVSD